MAVHHAELTECETPTVIVTPEHRGEAVDLSDPIDVVDVTDIVDLLQSTDDDEIAVCGARHAEHAGFFSDEQVGTSPAAHAMQTKRRRFIDGQRQKDERI